MTVERPDHHSVSSVQAYLRCPQKYKIKILDRAVLPKSGSTSSMSYGRCVHAGLEAAFVEHAQCGPGCVTMAPHSAAARTAMEAAWAQEGMSTEGGNLLHSIERLYATLEVLGAPDPADVLGVEWAILEPTPDGTLLKGFIDLLLRTPDGVEVRDWKGLALGTPIPTPSGWSTMGEIQVGDQVFAGDGSIATVTGKSPIFDRDCYRILFADGLSVVADDRHEWPLIVGTSRDERPLVLDTATAGRNIFDSHARPQRQLRLPNGGPLAPPERILPIPPYVLGAWIGDGSSRSGSIGKPDDELFQGIESEGFRVGPPDARGMTRTVKGLLPLLRENYLYGNKHIPAPYLRASIQQRLSLLRGLMDTDGTWNRVRDQAVFSTNSKTLARDVAELISTLGWKPRVWELTKRGFGLTITAYDVTFTPYGMNPFRMSRKADLVVLGESVKSRRRVIRAIESIPSVPTQCIEVDSHDHTYLCTEAMIPTHNCTSRMRTPVELMSDFQLAIYSGVVRRHYPGEKIFISHYYPNKRTEVRVEASPHHEADALATFEATVEMIESDSVFAPRPDDECVRCECRPLCPAWADTEANEAMEGF